MVPLLNRIPSGDRILFLWIQLENHSVYDFPPLLRYPSSDKRQPHEGSVIQCGIPVIPCHKQ